MPTKTKSAPTVTLEFLNAWLSAAGEVVSHIRSTRGSLAPYYRAGDLHWPLDATSILERDASALIEYVKNRHALDVGVPLERMTQAAMTWRTKRDKVMAFSRTKHADRKAAVAEARELERFADADLPEQRRLNLDLRIAEGAIWLARFPLLAAKSEKQRPFVIRANLICWAIWARDAFAEVIREWPLPDENELRSRQNEDDGATGAFLESQERWELANVIMPRDIPNTNRTSKKLAIEEARRAGDLAVALPRIDALHEELNAFVAEAVRWPEGNLQPARTEHLCRAITALEELVGRALGEPANDPRPADESSSMSAQSGPAGRETLQSDSKHTSTVGVCVAYATAEGYQAHHSPLRDAMLLTGIEPAGDYPPSMFLSLYRDFLAAGGSRRGFADFLRDTGHGECFVERERPLGTGDGTSPQRQADAAPSKAAAPNGATAEKAKSRKKRGRKPNTDMKVDKRIAHAWASGSYKTFADLERAMNLPAGEAKRAIDRHRKRK